MKRNGKSDSESRRKFIKKAGKLAIYTPPAMMLLMQPAAHAVSSCNNGLGNFGEGCSPNQEFTPNFDQDE